VPEAAGIVVVVALEHVDEINHHVGQLVHGAGHVLDQHACARLTRSTHDGDQALAHVPEDLARLRAWQQDCHNMHAK
jgi:hypothetical protein